MTEKSVFESTRALSKGGRCATLEGTMTGLEE